MAGLGGHQFINLGKLPNLWNDRDQMWRTYTDSPGNGHRLNKLTPRVPRGIWKGSGGHKFKNVGKMPNSCIDQDQIWHMYAYSSGNGHELKINPSILHGHGGWGSSIHRFGRASNPKGPIGTKFDTRMQIHLGIDMS